ncbi:MAG TPA: isochorismatase family protein [Chloroflexia bacterium]|nr:isochorismatase family protein [Chloroflexia bacterium]
MTDSHQTWEQYQQAGLGQAAGYGQHPALLIVDFCYGMTSLISPLGADMSSAIEAARQVQKICREKGFPVVYTTVHYSKGCKDGGAFIRKIPSLRIFEEGAGHWSEIDERIPPLEEEIIINKRFASAFFGTNLASLLTNLKVDTVIISGSTTSGCVRASALDALQNGFNVVVPRECVVDRAEGPHEANLFDLNAKYADVISLAETLDYLQELSSR